MSQTWDFARKAYMLLLRIPHPRRRRGRRPPSPTPTSPTGARAASLPLGTHPTPHRPLAHHPSSTFPCAPHHTCLRWCPPHDLTHVPFHRFVAHALYHCHHQHQPRNPPKCNLVTGSVICRRGSVVIGQALTQHVAHLSPHDVLNWPLLSTYCCGIG